MQELEKILEELKRIKDGNRKEKLYAKYPPNSKDQEVLNAYSQGYEDGTDNFYNAVVDIIRKHMNDGWIPVDKYGFPKDEGVYDLTIINGLEEYVGVSWQFLGETHLSGTQYCVDGVHYWADNYRGEQINEFLSERVIAWRKKPEPYRPEQPEACKYTGGSCCWPIDQCSDCPNNPERSEK